MVEQTITKKCPCCGKKIDIKISIKFKEEDPNYVIVPNPEDYSGTGEYYYPDYDWYIINGSTGYFSISVFPFEERTGE